MAQDRARVSIIDQNSGNKYLIHMPTNVSVGQLMPHLVNQLKLPTEGLGGAPISYNLVLETTEGRTLLSEDDILNEIGIGEATVLRITPEMVYEQKISGIQMIIIREWFSRTISSYGGRSDDMLKAWSGRRKLEDEVEVSIINPVNGNHENVVLSINITPARLISYLIKGLDLPTKDSNNNLISYSLILKSDNLQIILDNNKSLARGSVHRGAILQILPWIKIDKYIPKDHQEKIEEWKYLELDLQITPLKKGYQAEVLNSPSGQGSERIDNLDRAEVENFILRITRKIRGTRRIYSPEWYLAQEFGEKLFKNLFRGEVLGRLSASMQEAHSRKCGLRIKLRLQKSPEMMYIPWELLYYANRQTFLALREDLSIVRFLNVAGPNEPMKVKFPLHILAMASSPADLDPLDIEEEQQKITAALDGLIREGKVKIDWVNGGGLDSLHHHLLKNQTRYHIFHFIGHGGFDEKSGEGFLAMEGEGKRTVPITGNRLTPVLSCGKQCFRLTVLNACEGARTGIADPFSGMTTSLMLSYNMPAVVAMQFEVTDNAAIIFTSNFYEALAAGRPVETAVITARQALFAAHTDVEWAAPVLYMRSPDGRLFDIDKPESTAGKS